jgi:hypothetical protein
METSVNFNFLQLHILINKKVFMIFFQQKIMH